MGIVKDLRRDKAGLQLVQIEEPETGATKVLMAQAFLMQWS